MTPVTFALEIVNECARGGFPYGTAFTTAFADHFRDCPAAVWAEETPGAGERDWRGLPGLERGHEGQVVGTARDSAFDAHVEQHGSQELAGFARTLRASPGRSGQRLPVEPIFNRPIGSPPHLILRVFSASLSNRRPP